MFKIKDGCELEFQSSETKKLFDRTKKLIDKTKNGENVPSLETVEVVLSQSNLVFLKTYNTEFHEIIITITVQNGRPIETGFELNEVNKMNLI